MSEPTTAQEALGLFLRNLRQTWDDINVTQKMLADALGASAALVSSWESAGAIPPEDRLKQYARFFCSHRSVDTKPARLIPADDLTPAEESERQLLVDKLVRLREEALHRPAASRRETGALGGRFWYFADGQPITILCTPFSEQQLRGPGHENDPINENLAPVRQYALNPRHPNWIRNLNNGDIDALVELVGHVRAENPTIDIQWKTSDQITSSDDLTGNIVILGSADSLSDEKTIAISPLGVMEYILGLLELPIVVQDYQGEDPEFDLQFVVKTNDEGDPDRSGGRQEIYRPRFIRDESKPDRPWVFVLGAPQLEYDVALIARRPNPLNGSASVTLCSGLFSRGTYGAVRAFTDGTFRARNERYLLDDLNAENFWLLTQVPVVAGERTITPDLARPINRLRTS